MREPKTHSVYGQRVGGKFLRGRLTSRRPVHTAPSVLFGPLSVGRLRLVRSSFPAFAAAPAHVSASTTRCLSNPTNKPTKPTQRTNHNQPTNQPTNQQSTNQARVVGEKIVASSATTNAPPPPPQRKTSIILLPQPSELIVQIGKNIIIPISGIISMYLYHSLRGDDGGVDAF